MANISWQRISKAEVEVQLRNLKRSRIVESEEPKAEKGGINMKTKQKKSMHANTYYYEISVH